jgi:hypothetical protein
MSARATVTEYARHDAKPPEKEYDRASFRAASMVHTARVIAPGMSESDWRRVRVVTPTGGSVVSILTLAAADPC